MGTRVNQINLALKGYDRELYCKRDTQGCVHLYRKGIFFESTQVQGKHLRYSRSNDAYLFSLTHNWTFSGNPVDWGIEPLLQRLKTLDGWNRPELIEDLISQYDEDGEKKKKEFRAKNEDYARENYSVFKRAFKDVNTSNMDLKENRKRRYSNGHY